jgi:hypothetical protein
MDAPTERSIGPRNYIQVCIWQNNASFDTASGSANHVALRIHHGMKSYYVSFYPRESSARSSSSFGSSSSSDGGSLSSFFSSSSGSGSGSSGSINCLKTQAQFHSQQYDDSTGNRQGPDIKLTLYSLDTGVILEALEEISDKPRSFFDETGTPIELNNDGVEETNFYLLRNLPDLSNKAMCLRYRSNYIFTNTTPPQLVYINKQGKYLELAIAPDALQGIPDIQRIEEHQPLKRQIPQDYYEKFLSLITKNIGHSRKKTKQEEELTYKLLTSLFPTPACIEATPAWNCCTFVEYLLYRGGLYNLIKPKVNPFIVIGEHIYSMMHIVTEAKNMMLLKNYEEMATWFFNSWLKQQFSGFCTPSQIDTFFSMILTPTQPPQSRKEMLNNFVLEIPIIKGFYHLYKASPVQACMLAYLRYFCKEYGVSFQNIDQERLNHYVKDYERRYPTIRISLFAQIKSLVNFIDNADKVSSIADRDFFLKLQSYIHHRIDFEQMYVILLERLNFVSKGTKDVITPPSVAKLVAAAQEVEKQSSHYQDNPQDIPLRQTNEAAAQNSSCVMM